MTIFASLLSLFLCACLTDNRTQEENNDETDLQRMFERGEVEIVYGDETDSLLGKKCHHKNDSSSVECSKRKKGCTGLEATLWDDSCTVCHHPIKEHY